MEEIFLAWYVIQKCRDLNVNGKFVFKFQKTELTIESRTYIVSFSLLFIKFWSYGLIIISIKVFTCMNYSIYLGLGRLWGVTQILVTVNLKFSLFFKPSGVVQATWPVQIKDKKIIPRIDISTKILTYKCIRIHF